MGRFYKSRFINFVAGRLNVLFAARLLILSLNTIAGKLCNVDVNFCRWWRYYVLRV